MDNASRNMKSMRSSGSVRTSAITTTAIFVRRISSVGHPLVTEIRLLLERGTSQSTGGPQTSSVSIRTRTAISVIGSVNLVRRRILTRKMRLHVQDNLLTSQLHRQKALTSTLLATI